MYSYLARIDHGQTMIIGDPGPDALFNQVVYVRGGMALRALRAKVGDDVFFRIMRTYADRYRDGNASIEDFVALAEEISGQDLGDFFHAWLYEAQLPDIPEIGLYVKDYVK